MDFSPLLGKEKKEMLEKIGVGSIDELFAAFNPKLARELNIEKAGTGSELEVSTHMKKLAGKNRVLKYFLGAGAFDHYIPAAVDSIISRSEFYTAYTPYQAEVSQGTLQAIYEFQTYICLLTGMDAANASMYDGASALAESAFLAASHTERKEILVANELNPDYLGTLKTYCDAHDLTIVKGIDKIGANTACVILQNPDFFGEVETLRQFAEKAHASGALFIVCAGDPTSLAILESPGEQGADVVVGDGQAFGCPMSFGGPHFGFLAVKNEFVKKIPGRLAGMTVDSKGRRGFVLTLQAREQHIRRERASSNICSNMALCALAATAYLSLLGKTGLRNVALSSYRMAHLLQAKLAEKGFRLANKKPFYNEFLVECPAGKNPTELNEKLLEKGIAGGYAVEGNKLLLCCTEKITEKDIEEFVKIVVG